MAGVLVAAPALQSQQTRFSVGAGAAVPVGAFDDVVRVGWQVTGAAELSPRSLPVSFQISATYSQFNDESPFDITNQLIYGTADALYPLLSDISTRFRPHIIAGLGVYHSSETGDDALGGSATNLGFNAGAGLNFRVGTVRLFFESRFHDVFSDGPNVKFVPLTLGIRF